MPPRILGRFVHLALFVTAFAASLLAAEVTTPSAPAFLPSEEAWAKLPPHPRLFADVARIEALKRQNDEITRQLRVILKHETEKKLTLDPVTYPPTGFLMGQMRNVQGRILSLALSYRLTGDKRYFTKAREELLTLAALPEWRPSHFLDTGEAALAAGVGYDWLHDDLSPDDRDRVAQAIVKNAILPALETPDEPNSWVRGDFNWTQVCHGGVVVAALAIAEREPALARKVVARAVNNFDRVGATYAPDGTCAEGPGYWAYGTGFHVILVEALRSALGTGCGLEKYPGFLKTSDYAAQMISATGRGYNYSDSGEDYLDEDPIMLWFARERRDRSIARAKLAAFDRNHAIITGGTDSVAGRKYSAHRHLPLELFWWDPPMPAGQNSRPLHWTASGVLPLGVMRSAWDDRTASFLAIKGGTPNHSHAQMDVGSFILETDGVRWAVDLGSENYNTMRKAKLDLWNYSQDSTRWTCFRVGPEGHSILRFDGAYQNVNGKAEIRALPAAADGTLGNVVELSPLYAGQVARVERTVKL
ncbi:MAG: heparinase II/III family protein, partial [Opitutaceae bacterium]|nr:heparinase II/III family protein [Opitutaceae bacterium]